MAANFDDALANFALLRGFGPVGAAEGSGGAPPEPAAPAAEDFGIDDRSHLGEYLLEQWSYGLMSAKLVQEIASRAHMDGINLSMIVSLSKIGNSGVTSKCDRDLRRLFHADIELPPPLWLKTKVVSYKTSPPKLVDAQIPIMPIYEVFDVIHKQFAYRI